MSAAITAANTDTAQPAGVAGSLGNPASEQPRGGSREISHRLVTLREVTTLGQDRLPTALLDQITKVVDQAGKRMQLSAGHTVVALAGATGSGKSSLFNALTGKELAAAGLRRPTTSTTNAAVWGSASAAKPLLDWLGVGPRHLIEDESGPLAGLILLDLPDHDSQALTHRLEVDRLVEQVDLLVWVTDPQKYADAALHTDYLRPLAGHGAVTVVVLNQIDTLQPEQARQCLTDLSRLVREDGMTAATVLGVSARTGAGLEALRTHIRDTVTRHEVMIQRISADLDAVVAQIQAQVPTPDPGSSKISRQRKQVLVQSLCQAAAVPTLAKNVALSYRRSAVSHTGWPLTRWMRQWRPDPLRRWLTAPANQTELDHAQTDLAKQPAVASVARSQVELAVRALVDAQTKGLPAWQTQAMCAQLGAEPTTADSGPTAARPANQVIDELMVQLQLVVGKTVTLLPRRPAWWRLFAVLQWFLLALTLTGVVWLGGIFAWQWLQLPALPIPKLGAIPVPTCLVFGGLLAAAGVSVLGQLVARMGAKRVSRLVQAQLGEQISQLVETHLLARLRAQLETYARLVKRIQQVKAGR